MVLDIVVTWVIAYAITNLDDVLLLAAFLSHPGFGTRNVVVGECLGLGTILAVAVLGAGALASVPAEWIGLLGVVPIAVGVRMALGDDAVVPRPSDEPDSAGTTGTSVRDALARVVGRDTYAVWAITVANGGDNFGVYLPLLSAQGPEATPIVVGVFVVMIGLWCLIAYAASEHPLVGRLLERYSGRLLPYALVGLGLFVLVESGTLWAAFELLAAQ